jgi:hypothetical protein
MQLPGDSDPEAQIGHHSYILFLVRNLQQILLPRVSPFSPGRG